MTDNESIKKKKSDEKNKIETGLTEEEEKALTMPLDCRDDSEITWEELTAAAIAEQIYFRRRKVSSSPKKTECSD